MSYLVLARKYRPQTFETVVGQAHVTQTLIHSIDADRVAHAILFSGPRGTGKTTVARILAKAMNCEKGPAPIPCNTCRSCREITGDSAADVFEIDGASNNSVDQVRELRDNIVFMPNTGRFKIYIIDEVHMLSTSAFNALLKTLEEPPAHVLFLFATTEIRKIPITILSRCQRHDLRRIDHALIVSHLEKICEEEGIEAHPESLDLIARQADGSMRDALSLLDQVIAGSQGEVTVDFVLDIIGGVDRATLFGLSEALLAGDVHLMLSAVADIHKNGQDPGRVYIDLLAYLRDLTVVKLSGASGQLIDRPQVEIDAMTRQAEEITDIHLTQVFELLYREEATVRLSSQPRMAMEMVLLKLARIQPVLPIDTLIEKLDLLKNSLKDEPGLSSAGSPCGQSRPETPLSKPDAAPAPSPMHRDRSRDITINTVEELTVSDQTWAHICRQLEEIAPALAPSLAGSTMRVADKDRVTIELSGGDFNLEMATRKKNRSQIERLVKERFGSQAVVVIQAGVTRDKDSKPRRNRTPDLQKRALEHPIVNDAIEIFKGKIEKVTIIEEGDQ